MLYTLLSILMMLMFKALLYSRPQQDTILAFSYLQAFKSVDPLSLCLNSCLWGDTKDENHSPVTLTMYGCLTG